MLMRNYGNVRGISDEVVCSWLLVSFSMRMEMIMVTGEEDDDDDYVRYCMKMAIDCFVDNFLLG